MLDDGDSSTTTRCDRAGCAARSNAAISERRRERHRRRRARARGRARDAGASLARSLTRPTTAPTTGPTLRREHRWLLSLLRLSAPGAVDLGIVDLDAVQEAYVQ